MKTERQSLKCVIVMATLPLNPPIHSFTFLIRYHGISLNKKNNFDLCKRLAGHLVHYVLYKQSVSVAKLTSTLVHFHTKGHQNPLTLTNTP